MAPVYEDSRSLDLGEIMQIGQCMYACRSSFFLNKGGTN